MRSQSLILALLAFLVFLTVLSGRWVWRQLTESLAPPQPATAPASPTASPAPTASPVQAPPGYRLAGVAVGDSDSFAVIEEPTGRHTLYHIDADIPGLGRLLTVEAEHVVIAGTSGQFELWVAPAPTASPTRARPSTARPAGTREPMAKPATPAPGGRAPGSTPSSAPG